MGLSCVYLYENWPKMGIIAAGFILVLLFFNSRVEIFSQAWLSWLAIPLYMVHQFEEFAYPGGFKEEMVRILGSKDDKESLITERAIVIVNIIGIWVGFTISNILNTISEIFSLIIAVIIIFNALWTYFSEGRTLIFLKKMNEKEEK